MTRTCGGCTVCCKLIEVEELQKPQWKQCGFAERGAGCAIYHDSRLPAACKKYECVWLSRPDLLPIDAQRPDKLGMLFMETNTGRLLIIEAWAGGFGGPDVFRSVKAVTDAYRGSSEERPLAVGNALYMTDEEQSRTLCQCPCHQTTQGVGVAVIQHKTSCCWRCPYCTLNVKHQFAQEHRIAHQRDEKDTKR